MKNKELLDDTLDAIHMALKEKRLMAGNPCTCFVDTLITNALNYKISTEKGWIDYEGNEIPPDWFSYLIEGNEPTTLGAFQLASLYYKNQELFTLQRSFEENSKTNSANYEIVIPAILEVVKVLAEIHDFRPYKVNEINLTFAMYTI